MVNVGSRPALNAIRTLRSMPGVVAVGVQKLRGRDYIIVTTQTGIGRQTREVPVSPNGMVADAAATHALRVTLGRGAADSYAVAP